MKCWEIRVFLLAILNICAFIYGIYDYCCNLQQDHLLQYAGITENANVTTPKVKRVILFVLDGIGTGPITYPTSTIQSIINSGLSTFNGETVMPTLSGPCWGSLFRSVPPEKHGITNLNAINPSFLPQYPSILRLIREHFFNSVIAVYDIWSPIHIGVMEPDIGTVGDSHIGGDDYITDKFLEYLDNHDTPFFTLMGFDDTDHMGHMHGYFTPDQYLALFNDDKYAGQILRKIEEKGELNDTLVIFTTDHGGGSSDDPKMHGGDTPRERTIFFAAKGPGIPIGVIENETFSIKDVAPIISYLLGLPIPKIWEGKVPKAIVDFNTGK